jgi:hypothetical protein
MIKKDTLLILGAGASMDYGFPSGKQLIQDIINFLDGPIYSLLPDEKQLCIAIALQRYYKKKFSREVGLQDCREKVKMFSNSLIQASPASIDDFMDKNREDGFDIIGKICIVLCISRYEKPDESFFLNRVEADPKHRYYNASKPYNKYLEIREGWYGYLWKKIYEGDDIKTSTKKLTFITFNYDRSLEYFLYVSFKNMLGMSDEKAAEFFNENVYVYHVYGQIGHLVWQSEGTVKNNYGRLSLKPIVECTPSFLNGEIRDTNDLILRNAKIKSAEKCSDDILSLADEIRTYTQATLANKDWILERVDKVKVVFFLGFGYHPQNLGWLKEVMRYSVNYSTVGTTYGLGKLQVTRIESDLRKVYGFHNISKMNGQYTDMKIREFFSNEFDIE